MPILDPQSMEIISRSAEQTRRVGMRLGALLNPGDVIALVGDLGSGKTTFVQGIAAGWGSLDPATSPSFVLLNQYRRYDGNQLYHLDAYRLENASQAIDLDLYSILDDSPLIIEWADRIEEILPEDYLIIELRWIAEEQRDLLLKAKGEKFQEMLDSFRVQVYGVR